MSIEAEQTLFQKSIRLNGVPTERGKMVGRGLLSDKIVSSDGFGHCNCS
jgi:hypothetical protein